jgi:signal peptidase I
VLRAGGLVAGAAGVILVVAALASHVHIQPVLSGSMAPTAAAGDLAITQPVPVESLQVGDVIAFRPPGADTPVLHRITSIGDGTITTRGDANPVDDPWRIRLAGTTAYRLVTVVPFVGWFTSVRGPLLIIGGLVLGAALVVELRRR